MEREEKAMKYAIYFTWGNYEEDSFIVNNAKERDSNIKELIDRKEFKEILYCKIYKNGEYGRRIKVL